MKQEDLILKKNAAIVAQTIYELTKTRDFLIEAFNESASPAVKSRMSDLTRKIDHGMLKGMSCKTKEKREENAIQMFDAMIQRSELLNTVLGEHDKRFVTDLPRVIAGIRADVPKEDLANPGIEKALEDAGAPLLARSFKKSLSLKP